MSKKTKGKALSFRTVLNMYALIPLIIASCSIGLAVIIIANTQIKDQVYNTMISSVNQIGRAYDYSMEQNAAAIESFAAAPIVKELLQNPKDAKLQAKAQEYTMETYGTLNGFEALYIATWDTLVLTHPVEGVLNKPTREGDSLKTLQDAMLAADGVYNTGILTSPASGELVMALYYPVMDGGKPIGFIGAAVYVHQITDRLLDVSKLGMDSAYVYFVDNKGTMLSHPDKSKIGNPVENAAIKLVLSKLEAGEHPETDCVDYLYKGVMKYASYYVGNDESFIAVLTADEKDALSPVQHIKNATFTIFAICLVVCATLAIFFAKIIAKPLSQVAKSIEIISTGDITTKCDAKSTIRETVSIINSVNKLEKALGEAIGKVKDSASVLNTAIINVDDKTAKNVESVTQINEAIVEVATTSQTIAENAQGMASKSVILEQNIEDLNNNVKILLDASQTIQDANSQANTCMHSVYEGSSVTVEAIHSISSKIEETNTAVENISQAVVAIESIAEQTNLLSLNASIEAARAGESGRGFAVVADEIRTLADSSAESAKEIKSIIENVTKLSGETVEIAENVFEIINNAQKDIEATQNKFGVLSQSVEASIVEIQKIRSMADTLDEIKSDLSTSIVELSAISEEMGASSEEVAASCQEVTEACTDTQASTEEMRAINETMIDAIEYFKV